MTDEEKLIKLNNAIQHLQSKAKEKEAHKGSFKIFKQEKGLISKEDCWVCLSEGYMYIADTKDELLDVITNEWKHDKHIVG